MSKNDPFRNMHEINKAVDKNKKPLPVRMLFVLLFVLCVTVRLIAQFTDNEMLLFNEQTVRETMVFKYLYSLQDFLLGDPSV